MTHDLISRRASLAWITAVGAGLSTGLGGCQTLGSTAPRQVFDVHDFGATGDGVTPDTQALQRAVDAAGAAGKGARVLLRGGHVYLTGPVKLAGGIDLHLDGNAEIRVSTRPEDYANPLDGVLHAKGADGLTISGTGTINGRSPDFMASYDADNEWWVPKAFRPKLLVLEDCQNLTIRDVTFAQAPSWTVHLLGCRRVLIDSINIRNQPDVPNCDGIDPDHCQDVLIRNCHIVCGDDAIVIKTTKNNDAYGPSRNITVRDCVLETQDSGLKIGTETTQDIHDILFERCHIVNACRGLCIQLRDQGSVYNVTFRDITFTARYFSAPWWGRGEAISFTALPRTPQTILGTIHDIRVENVEGRAENSVRVQGHATSRIHDVVFDHVRVTFNRWTKYPGALFDNRPTMAVEPIETHETVGFCLRTADQMTLNACQVQWGATPPAYFTHALLAEDTTGLDHAGLTGTGAHPDRDEAALIVSH